MVWSGAICVASLSRACPSLRPRSGCGRTSPEGRLNKPVNLSKTPTASGQDPTWSPDGKKIAFVTDRDSNAEIYRMRATDGANPTNLTNAPGNDTDPSWQPLP